MNQGKRQIRNTLLAVCGITVLIPGATRLYASVVDPNTPMWMSSVLSLGLKVANADVKPQAKALQVVALGDVREFTQVEIEGAFAVEVIGAQQYRVSMTPAPGRTGNIGAEWNEGGLLRIKGGAGAAGAVLRIEVPTLASIDLQGAELLTVRGLQAPVVSLHTKNVKVAEILESKVGTWDMTALTPLDVRMGNGTSSDLNLKVSGKSTISYIPKAKELPQP
ncbi:MAG: hypothetical protein ABI645_05885 [Pseudomonadota bacterium]